MASIRHCTEYVALRAVSGLLCLLPYRCALGLAWGIAWLTFHVVRFRRRKTLARIREVFPGISAKEAKAIAWTSLRNLFFNIAELMRLPVCGDRWFERYLGEHRGIVGQLAALASEYGGVMMAVPHCGNWDLAGVFCAHYGLRICAISGRQRNRLIDAWLERMRGGMVVLERGRLSDIRKAPRMLREGYTMAVLPDVRMRHPDLSVPFFGGVANVGSGMAHMAAQAGIPIQPIVVRRKTWTRFEVKVLPAILPDEGGAASPDRDRDVTARVLAMFEEEIRKTPGQWFWYNSRWILDPVK